MFRPFPSVLALVFLGFLGPGFALVGCASLSALHGDSRAAALLADSIAHPARPEADRADDANRKPAQVLEAIGIEPGMRVLDLLAGGGYYSEILSRTVGSDGSVLFHNNLAYREFITAEVLAIRTGLRDAA